MRIVRTIAVFLVSMLLVSLHGFAAASGATANTSSSAASSSAPDGGSGFSFVKDFLNAFTHKPELLPPEEAFTVKMRVQDATTLVAEFKPVQGYYLYRDRIRFRTDETAAIAVERIALPDGKPKADPTFGTVPVFYSPFEATITIKRLAPAASNGSLHFTYQGCSEQGVCYPPMEKTFDFVLPASVSTLPGLLSTTGSLPISEADRSKSINANVAPSGRMALAWLDEDYSAELLSNRQFAWVMLGFFGFGLLLSLTPCVWPMFPILSSIIARQGATTGRRRAFWLSAVYVFGMAATYAILGVAAGLSGTLLSTALQTPWAIAVMASLFVLFALSMFGLYELQMPAFLQNRINSSSNGIGTRSASGVFATGAVSAIIIGPCIAAPLAGALLYIGQTQDVVLGGAALFALALGKGVPLVAVGTSLGTLLPRAGSWMQSIKVFLGVLLLATAVWTASPLIPTRLAMALVGALFACYAVYLGMSKGTSNTPRRASMISKGLGVMSLVVGAVYLAGAARESQDFLRPLAGFGQDTEQLAAAPLPFERIRSASELDARLRDTEGRYVMLDFYADWCVSCKEMEHRTFSDPVIRQRLENVVLLQADVTANSDEDKQLLSRFGLFGSPAILFFDPSGKEIKGRKVIGFKDADQFNAVLDQILLQTKTNHFDE